LWRNNTSEKPWLSLRRAESVGEISFSGTEHQRHQSRIVGQSSRNLWLSCACLQCGRLRRVLRGDDGGGDPAADRRANADDPASSTTGSYTVSWTSAATATRYELQEQFNGGNWTTQVNGNVTSQAFTEKPDGTYGYRVQACNAGGCGGYSATNTMTVQRPMPVPGVPTGINMQQMGGSMCRITWNSVSGATHYEVSLDGSIETPPGTTYTWDGLCPGSLQVRACNAYGCSAWGS
jgi:hypothetical protein